MKPITVLTIVNEPLVQRLLSVNLERIGLLVTGEEDVEKACDALRSVTPDLIIFDSDCVPGHGGWLNDHLHGHVRSKGIPIITLMGDKAGSADKGLAWSGNVLTKPFAIGLLLDRVRLVLQKALAASDDCLRAGELSLNPLTCRASHGQAEIPLRPKEFRLLSFLMAHVDRVFSRDQILNELWGSEVFVDERAVDVTIRRLRAALEPHGLADWIETVRGAGYRFRA